MTSWLARISSARETQLFLTAVISGVLTVAAVVSYQNAARRYRVRSLKESIPSSDESRETSQVCSLRMLAVALNDGDMEAWNLTSSS